MSLNITYLLNTLQGFYDSSKGTGNKYTGTEENISNFISAYGLSGVTEVELTSDNLSKSIIDGGVKVTVSALNATKFSYKIDAATNKIIIFGNNLTINVNAGNEDLIEVVGISNEVCATSSDDKVTLMGFDNKVNAEDGKDTITVYGEDNILKDSEVNIFKGVGGQYLIVDDKEFLVSINNSDDIEETTLNYKKTTDGIKFSADNIKIIAQSDSDDVIAIEGSNNYIDTSAGADEISVDGNNNIIITGVDNEIDTVSVNGEGNEIVAGEEDKVNYSGTKGYVNIASDDNSQHYITITDSSGISHEYLIERNTDSTESVQISYEIDENDQIIFVGDNAKIIIQSDDVSNRNDNIFLYGDNNYIDTGVGDDEITISGENNVIITGEGADNIYIKGASNQVTGDENDKVFYTENFGSVVITPEDESQHYIKVDDFEYFVQRNTENSENVTFTYNASSDGVFEFEGDYFKITQQNDDIEDRIKIKGNYSYVDTGNGNDRIDIEGNNNIIHAGEGDDSVVVQGNNNEAYGDDGQDGIAVEGNNNIKESFEYEDKIITLNSENEFESTLILGEKKYTFALTKSAIEEEKEVKVLVQDRNGIITVEADDIVVTAGYGQVDIINFIGNNSKIFALDKDDVINVLGNNNYVDGWTGNDKITVTGRNNKAYGFLGDDEITVIQTEASTNEILDAYTEKLSSDEDDSFADLSLDEQVEEITKNINEENSNYVNGEFGKNSVNASYYTDIDNVLYYTSLSNKIKMNLNESERKIVVEGKTYTITNYITYDSSNPFKIPRTISYDLVDVTINGEIQKQLVVKGDYIKVVADDEQEDNIIVIGEKNYIDMGDEADYLEVQGKYNMIFAGIGNDSIKVEGDENTISGGLGYDVLQIDGENSVWKDVEEVTGLYETKLTLTNSEREKTIVIEEGLEYTIKANIDDDKEMEENISFSYSVKDGVLNIIGNNIQVIAKKGQKDNVKLTGDNSFIDLGDKNDIVEVIGSNNEVYGGSGNDIIKLYGESFKAFGNEGADEFIVNAMNSTIYSGDEKSKTLNDKITILGNNQNTYNGFDKTKISHDYTSGLVILNSNNLSSVVKYKDIDGKEIAFNVEPNILNPEKLADEIFVEYKIEDVKDEENNVIAKRIIFNNTRGSNVSVNLTNGSDKSIYAKIIGSNIKFQTYSGADNVEVEGNNNEIYVSEGISDKYNDRNIITVNGDSNKVYGGKSTDTFNVKGDNNTLYGGGIGDVLNLEGQNNTYQISYTDNKTGGSLTITKDNQPQIFAIKGETEEQTRFYKITLYNIAKEDLETASVNMQYFIDSDGYMNFVADNIKIEVQDNRTTQTTDEITTDNRDFIRLIGNNCYLKASNGSDILLVKGNNNVIDGWYGDDSIVIEEGNDNEIRGFDGNDKITITKGNNNIVNGENGYDTLDIFEGEGNSYTNIDKYKQKNK